MTKKDSIDLNQPINADTMEKDFNKGIPLDKSKLRIEEHIEGCTIYWKRPRIFGK